MAALESDLSDLSDLDGSISTNSDAMADVEDLLDYITVDTDDHTVVFSGANVFVQSGSGYTDDDGTLLGLGNLFIGYNEDSDSDEDQTGSHNLVIGKEHSFTSYAGLIAGYNNTVSGRASSVSAGYYNRASGDYSSVYGSSSQTASSTHDCAP